MIMFAIVFGLSMDYEVFLLSRVKEAWDRTADQHESVAIGLASTGRVIIAVFSSFVTSTNVVIKQLAAGLAVSVLIDATVVRLVLVPGVMYLLGTRSWWLPRWLGRILPRIDVEGGAEPPVTAGAGVPAQSAPRSRYRGHVDDDELPVSYQGVTPGVPVLTRDGTQFGILEHVLESPEEDIFDGIVVWTGGSGWLDRRIQRDLSTGAASAARRLELLQPQHLRFVDADTVAAITVGYIRCDLDAAQATALPPPAHDAPLFYANAIDQAPGYPPYGNQPLYGNHAMYGALFRRARWTREN